MRDLREFLDEALDLPIGGSTYRVDPPTALAGLRLERLAQLSDRLVAGDELTEAEAAEISLDDGQEIDFYRDNLGAAYDEMVAGGVRWNELQVAAQTAFVTWTKGREAGEIVWEAAGGKATAATPPPAPRSTSTTTARASSTKPRGSGSGTTSRRASSPKSSAATRAKASRSATR